MLITSLIVAIAGLLRADGALYEGKNSGIATISHTDFKSKIKESSNELILVHYYNSEVDTNANAIAEEVVKAAPVLGGIVQIYGVEESGPHKRTGMKLYVDGSAESVPETALGAAELVEWVMPKVQDTLKNRMKKQGLSSKKSKKASPFGKVIKLTKANFDDMLMGDSDNAWFVKFYAPWCGHCKSMEGTWKELAKAVGERLRIAEVDATVETELAQRFKVQGYPTLLMFPAGKKSDSKVQPYQGSRELSPMTAFAFRSAGASMKPIQIHSQDHFDELCDESLCIVAVLPHILDSSAAERKKYLKMLKSVMVQESEYPMKYLWMEGGNNLEWESTMRLQFGWPAAVAISKPKNFYRIHRGGFTFEAIQNWIRGLGMGRIMGDPMPQDLVALKRMEKWDGKDAPPQEEEPKDEL